MVVAPTTPPTTPTTSLGTTTNDGTERPDAPLEFFRGTGEVRGASVPTGETADEIWADASASMLNNGRLTDHMVSTLQTMVARRRNPHDMFERSLGHDRIPVITAWNANARSRLRRDIASKLADPMWIRQAGAWFVSNCKTAWSPRRLLMALGNLAGAQSIAEMAADIQLSRGTTE